MARTPRGRLVGALGVIGTTLVIVTVLWLSLSDRGFGVVGDAADGARIVVRDVEDRLDTNIVNRSDIPWEADEVAHLLGWGGLMVVVGLMFRSRRSISDLAVGVFAASVCIEFLQKFLTTSRSLEAEDISANALGVMVGLMMLVGIEKLTQPG